MTGLKEQVGFLPGALGRQPASPDAPLVLGASKGGAVGAVRVCLILTFSRGERAVSLLQGRLSVGGLCMCMRSVFVHFVCVCCAYVCVVCVRVVCVQADTAS